MVPTTEPTAVEAGSRRFAGSVAAIVVVAVLLRLVYVALTRDLAVSGFDARWYHRVALELADGRGFTDPIAAPGRATARWPPGYPAFLSVFAVLGARSFQAGRIVGAFADACTVVGVALLGRKVGGAALGVRAAIVAALWPPLIENAGALMSESLSVPITVLLLVVAYRARDHPTLLSFALLGVVGAADVYVRQETLLLFVILVVVTVITAHLRIADALARGAVALVVLVALAAPWAVRNTNAMGRPTSLSTDAGVTIGGANCPLTYRGSQIGFWSAVCGSERLGETEAAADRRLLRDASDYARRRWRRLPVVAAARFGRVWGLYPVGNQLNDETQGNRWRPFHIASWIVFVVFLPVAIVGLVDLHRAARRIAILVVPLVSASLVAVLVYGEQRFRLDAEPTIVIAIAAASFRLRGLRRFAALEPARWSLRHTTS